LILVDASELSSNSRLVEIPNSKKSTTLESLTGADIMITPLSISCRSMKMVKLHVKAGALLIQRKSGEDLVRSIGERINSSLARMKATGAKQWQCILLSTGYYAPKFDDKNQVWVGTLKSDATKGKPYIWWHEVKWSYYALQTELRHYAYRGGVYIPLSCDDEIPMWCKRTEEEIMAFSSGEKDIIKQIWPGAKSFPLDPPLPNDPLQELREVKDARRILAQIPGVGPVLANRVWNAIRERRQQNFPNGPEYLWEPDFMLGLTYLVSDTEQWRVPKGLKPIKIKGIGKRKRASIRKALGIPDGTVVDFRIQDIYQLNKWEEKWASDMKNKIAKDAANTTKER